MGLWQRIKNFFTGGGSSKRTSSRSSSRSSGSYRRTTVREARGDSVAPASRRQTLNAQREKREKEREEKAKARRAAVFAAKKGDYKSMGDALKRANSFSSGSTRTATPDPKEELRLRARQRRENERKAFDRATNNRYNVSGARSKTEELRRRQAQKSQAFDADAAKHEVKYHPVSSSLARGALSGVTFGASDLAAKKLTKGRAREAERYYQKNKNKTAEAVGEIAGSLASFGGTAKGSAKVAGKVARKVAPKAGEKSVARLAESGLIRASAKKAAEKAVKKGIAKEASEELIKELARGKAKRIVTAAGEDLAVNATTGALYDFNRAAADTDNLEDAAKEFGKSAALNLAVGGAISALPAVRSGRRAAQEAVESVASRKGAKEAAERLIKRNSSGALRRAEAPKVGYSLDSRIAKSDVDRAANVVADDAKVVRNRRGRSVRVNNAPAAETVSQAAESETLRTLRDPIVPYSQKRAAYENRIEAMDREFDEAAEGINRGDRSAAARYEALQNEARELDREMQAAERTARGDGSRQMTLSDTADDFDYATVDERMPTDNPRQTEINDIRSGAERRAEDVMRNEPAPEAPAAETATRNADEAAENAPLTEGQREARKAYAEATGQTLNKDGSPATDEQIYDALQKYEKSQGTDHKRKLSKAASSQVRVSTEDAAATIDNLMANSDVFEYETVSHRDMYEEVARDLERDWDRWIDKITDVAENESWEGKEGTKLLYMAQYLSEIADSKVSPEQSALAETAWKAIKTLSSSAGQTLNGRRAYVHLSKAGKMESAIDDLVKILDSSIGFNSEHAKAMKGLNRFEREHYIKGQLMSDPKIKESIIKLSNATTEDAVSEAYTELLLNFNRQNPKSKFDVIQELRYLNMLGNPKTHIRNVFGSAFFAPFRQVSNAIRAGIEDRIAKNAGLEVTKHGGMSLTAMKEAWSKNPKTEAGIKASEAFKTLRKDILGSAKYETPKYTGRAKYAPGKVFDKIADFNSTLLTKEDDFFRERAFKENYIKTYNRYLKDGKPITETVERRIEAEAIRESQIATFNEYNSFAKWLNNTTRKAYDMNASGGARWAARGLNAIMPFEKVPANIMKESINYSPLGIARGLSGIKKAAREQDAAALNQAIDELASGMTGTGVMGLGYLLGKTTDMFTTNAGKDDPGAKFKKDRGMQNYSITFKDPETGKGFSFTLDWLVPTSATFFSGVELANQMKKGDFDLADLGGDWAQVASRLVEPVMETSMLSGLHSMLETMRGGYGGDDTVGAIHIALRETAQNYINSMVPTIAGQAARTAYKTDMQISGDTDSEYFRNSLKSKAGLANTKVLGDPLGADTDAYGNVKGEKKNSEDYAKSFLKNFISPANIQRIDFSKVDEAKLAEYEKRVKDGEDPEELAYLFPKKQYKKTFKVAGEEVKMSNKDLSAYNQAKTKGGEEGMRYILENIMFNRQVVGADGKKTPSDDAYTKADKAKLMKQFKGKSLREVEEWLYDQPEFQSATDAERRKAINGLWNLSSQGKANAAKRVGEQAVVKAQGGDVNEYNFLNELPEKKRKNLQAAIDNGIVTYEEAVDFARNGGKTYYYENDEGGYSQVYFNKREMIEYLIEKGYSYEKAEALFNAFKASNAKPYSGNSLYSGRGYRRRGYRRRGYRRRGGGGSGGLNTTIKAGQFKAKKASYEDMAASLKKSSSSGSRIKVKKAKAIAPTPKKSSQTPKIAPPKVKFKKYEV